MFGVNSLKQLSQIGEGWAKDIMNKEQQLYESRIKICKKCPLFTDDLIFKGKCDAKKYYNPETKELSNFPGKGFISGCGCKLSAKTRIKDAKCVLKKW